MTVWIALIAGCSWLEGAEGEVPAPRDEVETPGGGEGEGRDEGGRRGRGRRGRGEQPLTTVSLQVDGRERSAFVHVPEQLPKGEKVPLVIMFHGGKSNGMSGAKVWSEQFERDFILAFPNGQDWKPERSGWDLTDGDVRQHVRFVDALIDDLVERFPVDRDRIYATGFSDGGQMTFRLACLLDDHFAGFAMVAQTMKEDTLSACAPKTPRPILYVTGTADPKNPAEGREGGRDGRTREPRDDGQERSPRIGIEDTLDYWLEHNRCDKSKEQVRALPDKPGDQTRVRERLFDTCKGAPIRFLVIEGGGHSWPTPEQRGGDHCSDISTSEEALAWWRAHGGFDG
jgi:polyhydroxybutyrate depolymerase